MDAQFVLTTGQQALTLLLMLSAPLLGVILVVGLAVSVVQAITQLQEQTLSFIPKLLAAVAVMIVAGPWMLSQLVEYIRRVLQSLPQLVQ